MTLTITMAPITATCPAGTHWDVWDAGIEKTTYPIIDASCTVTLHRKKAFTAICAASPDPFVPSGMLASDWGALAAVTLVTNADDSGAPGFRPENILVECPLKDPDTGEITSFGIQIGDNDIFMSERGDGNPDGTGCTHLVYRVNPITPGGVAYGWQRFIQPCVNGVGGRVGSDNMPVTLTATLTCD
jgi:hypothetical protein